MNNTAQQFATAPLAGENLLQALQRDSGLQDLQLIDAAKKGAVWVSLERGRSGTTTKPCRAYNLTEPMAKVASVMLNYDPMVLQQLPLPMQCIEEHKNYGIWFKPSGMLCQGSKWSDHTTVTSVASLSSARRCYLVHRLDKAASGLILLAYTKNALKALHQLFEKRDIEKHYQAVVIGKFDQALPLTIDTPLEGRRAKTIIVSKSTGSTDSTVAEQKNIVTTLQMTIETGRKHQIRKHLAHIGHPIVGDRLYAPSTSDTQAQPDLQLIATGLAFKCPFTKKKVSVSAKQVTDNTL